MDRRRFLMALAGGLAGAAVVRGADGPGGLALAAPGRPGPDAGSRPPAPPPVLAADLPVPSPPPAGVVTELPGAGTSLALTLDDGTDSEVVGAFTSLAAATGLRLTFFPNGRYSSWQENAPALRPLVDSGQVALGNHTWSHPDLTTLTDTEVAREIRRNRDFLRDVFGVRDSPFFRPPFGARDERTDRIAADLGHPTIAMWNGTLDDARVISGEELIAAAHRWFAGQAIIVGHANQPTVTTVFDDLLGLLYERGLSTVTLADVWATPAQAVRGAAVTAVVQGG